MRYLILIILFAFKANSIFSQDDRSGYYNGKFLVYIANKSDTIGTLAPIYFLGNIFDTLNIEETVFTFYQEYPSNFNPIKKDTFFIEIETNQYVVFQWRFHNDEYFTPENIMPTYGVDWYLNSTLLDTTRYTYFYRKINHWVDCTTLLKTDELGSYHLQKLGKFQSNLPVIKIQEKQAITNVQIDEIVATAIHFYPNPTSEFLNIQHAMNAIGKASIYNMQGQLLKSYPLAQATNITQISLGDFDVGTYIIKISNNKQSTTSKKVIVSNK
ncbi:hypothetical protein DNU06_11810 [Putridiphycobacter roseus]|uniref:Secretion system C-terminal sorting domain-containing protein n=1 Tax=Putridiphycobacter roseus TaxID=2219161 RepID=A0A2W1NB63_9FLAO|nr:T9SS type A sorting domain-containing protein [Putridiphycobacter roseus]PZE16535.1 hypothetical protein DNU06_11810 [Putridiphycobacter roseus]